MALPMNNNTLETPHVLRRIDFHENFPFVCRAPVEADILAVSVIEEGNAASPLIRQESIDLLLREGRILSRKENLLLGMDVRAVNAEDAGTGRCVVGEAGTTDARAAAANEEQNNTDKRIIPPDLRNITI